MELLLLRSGVVVHTTVVGRAPVRVGRASGNQLVLADPTVSGHHMVAWQDAGLLWIKDLNSTNGTYVNERRVLSVQALQDGDRIRLGNACVLQVRLSPEAGTPGRPRGRVLEDIRAGTRFPLGKVPFTIGGGANVDLRLPDLTAPAATVFADESGAVTVRTADGVESPIEPGIEFYVGERSFRVVEVDLEFVTLEVATPE